LETTGASLAELYTMQQHFNALPTPAGLNADEKVRGTAVTEEAIRELSRTSGSF
jgi:hypothetical protein